MYNLNMINGNTLVAIFFTDRFYLSYNFEKKNVSNMSLTGISDATGCCLKSDIVDATGLRYCLINIVTELLLLLNKSKALKY